MDIWAITFLATVALLQRKMQKLAVTHTPDPHRPIRRGGIMTLMPMTHIPEIGIKNFYHKTGTINWNENRASAIHYWKPVPEKFDTMSGVSETGISFLVPVFGSNFC